MLCVGGRDCDKIYWDKAEAIFDEISQLDRMREVPATVTENYLAQSYYVARVLRLNFQQVNDALWAAVKLYGAAEAARHKGPAPQSQPEFWWQDHD